LHRAAEPRAGQRDGEVDRVVGIRGQEQTGRPGARHQGAERPVLLAELEGTSLVNASLRGTNLTNASLRLADLSGADLRGADLSGFDLQEVQRFSCVQISAHLQHQPLRSLGVDVFADET
jgi:hypothetical protein